MTATPKTQAPADDELELLKTDEAAIVLRMGEEWVRRQCAAGAIPAKKFGKEWRITRKALNEFMHGTGKVPSPRKRTARQNRRATT